MAEVTDEGLRLLVERIERLMEERSQITAYIRDVYAEAKARGYCTRTISAVIKRRAMAPADRAEADAVLETYEAALGGQDVDLPDMRPDIAALATALLAEQIEGLEDPARAALLVEHVVFLLDLRAEIAMLRKAEAERKKLAKSEGFDGKQLSATVRWYEKCAKHGAELMRAGEAIFRQYRGTVDAAQGVMPSVTSDDRLAKAFAPQPVKASPKLAATMAWIAMGGSER